MNTYTTNTKAINDWLVTCVLTQMASKGKEYQASCH